MHIAILFALSTSHCYETSGIKNHSTTSLFIRLKEHLVLREVTVLQDRKEQRETLVYKEESGAREKLELKVLTEQLVLKDLVVTADQLDHQAQMVHVDLLVLLVHAVHKVIDYFYNSYNEYFYWSFFLCLWSSSH